MGRKLAAFFALLPPVRLPVIPVSPRPPIHFSTSQIHPALSCSVVYWICCLYVLALPLAWDVLCWQISS